MQRRVLRFDIGRLQMNYIKMFGEFDNLDDALLGSLVGGAIIYGDNEGDDDDGDPQ